MAPTTPVPKRLPPITRNRFGLVPFRSPLLREFLFLRVLRCFSSPGALYPAYVFSRECLDITPDGLPHSDTAGSSFASNSPTLFAGSRVLPRRLVPRHPPRTLSSLSCLRPLFNPRISAAADLSLSSKRIQTRPEPPTGSGFSRREFSNFLTYSVDKVLQA